MYDIVDHFFLHTTRYLVGQQLPAEPIHRNYYLWPISLTVKNYL